MKAILWLAALQPVSFILTEFIQVNAMFSLPSLMHVFKLSCSDVLSTATLASVCAVPLLYIYIYICIYTYIYTHNYTYTSRYINFAVYTAGMNAVQLVFDLMYFVDTFSQNLWLWMLNIVSDICLFICHMEKN